MFEVFVNFMCQTVVGYCVKDLLFKDIEIYENKSAHFPQFHYTNLVSSYLLLLSFCILAPVILMLGKQSNKLH